MAPTLTPIHAQERQQRPAARRCRRPALPLAPRARRRVHVAAPGEGHGHGRARRHHSHLRGGLPREKVGGPLCLPRHHSLSLSLSLSLSVLGCPGRANCGLSLRGPSLPLLDTPSPSTPPLSPSLSLSPPLPRSTLLRALEIGVYNHVPGDGREFIATDASACKIRSEDGRAVTGLDISPFINNLPYAKPTGDFSTPNASGSTSQAANIVEAVQAGCACLLLDEVGWLDVWVCVWVCVGECGCVCVGGGVGVLGAC